MKLTKQEKIDTALLGIDIIQKKLMEACAALERAQNDWVLLNSADGDRECVEKPPVLSAIDGLVAVEMAVEVLDEMEQMLRKGEYF